MKADNPILETANPRDSRSRRPLITKATDQESSNYQQAKKLFRKTRIQAENNFSSPEQTDHSRLKIDSIPLIYCTNKRPASHKNQAGHNPCATASLSSLPASTNAWDGGGHQN